MVLDHDHLTGIGVDDDVVGDGVFTEPLALL
jgi:hypothetical protein